MDPIKPKSVITFLYILPLTAFAFAIVLQATESGIQNLHWIVESLIEIGAIILVLFTIFAALEHAEHIAHRVGEPYGTLVLTLAVTSIEVSIIVSMMLHGSNNPTLARESVFSTVMIVCTGVVGLAITLGSLRHKRQEIKTHGTTAFLSVLIALTVLTMVLPNYTLSADRGAFTDIQLGFVSLLAFLLYASFLFAQSSGQLEDFIEIKEDSASHVHGLVSGASLGIHIIFLLLGLVGIVLLTEFVAAGVEDGLAFFAISQKDAIIGAMIAFVILLPEAISAIKAALNNQLQRGLNVALGSACATIGLTIPAVSIASLITERPLTLGLKSDDITLLFLAIAMSVVSFSTGRTTLLTGLAHLVIFVAYVMLIFVP